MAARGLPRDTFMHEMGVSQFEINLLHGDPLLLALAAVAFAMTKCSMPPRWAAEGWLSSGASAKTHDRFDRNECIS